MIMSWFKENLTFGNLVFIGIGLIGFGSYYTSQESAAKFYEYRLDQQRNDISDLKAEIKGLKETANKTSMLEYKIDQLITDVGEIKTDAKATRRAVQ
jgi:uncharacterized protein YigA (DUF484 family)